MKSILIKMQVMGFLIALPVLAEDVGLHKVQPNLRGLYMPRM